MIITIITIIMITMVTIIILIIILMIILIIMVILIIIFCAGADTGVLAKRGRRRGTLGQGACDMPPA